MKKKNTSDTDQLLRELDKLGITVRQSFLRRIMIVKGYSSAEAEADFEALLQAGKIVKSNLKLGLSLTENPVQSYRVKL